MTYRSHTKEYVCWQNMINRCTKQTNSGYKNYGGRGITVCKRWMTFENFLADMGLRPEGLTLERKDNNKGYSPSNCKWATRTEQRLNQRVSCAVTYCGKTQTLAEWAIEKGISANALYSRMARGWGIERTLSTGRKRNQYK